MFRICEAFTEVAGGKFFSQGLPGEVHDPAEMASTAALADYGRRVKAKVENWWATTPDKVGAGRGRDLLRPAEAARGAWSARPGISASTRGNG